MRSFISAVLVVLLAACNRDRPSAASPPQPAPVCSCPCAAGPQPAPAGATAAPPLAGSPPGVAEDEQVLLASASRKMNHGDGAGCLQDLDRLQSIAPSHAQLQVMLRAQCEMLTGHCQEGKQRIDSWSRDQLAMPPEQRLRMAESLATIYCRGGNMSDRDKLLAAHYRLSQGAYFNQVSSAECQSDYETVRSLAPKVPPRNADDTSVSSIRKSLYHVAANCFARAGDCAAARRAFDESYPKDALNRIQDPALRKKAMDDTFAVGVTRCKP